MRACSGFSAGAGIEGVCGTTSRVSSTPANRTFQTGVLRGIVWPLIGVLCMGGVKWVHH